VAVGATPVYVEIDPQTLLMDASSLAKQVKGCAAVIVTHLYGRLADMDGILAAAKGVPVIEDCAQAHGAARGGRKAGSFGALASFSFYPTKNLGALGDGGAVVTSDAALAAEVRKLRQYGWSSKYHADAPGGRNSRLDEMQAAFLRVKLPYLDEWNDARRDIARRIRSRISHPRVELPPAVDEAWIAHLFVVRAQDRDGLAAHLRTRSIPSDVHYPIPDYRQPALGSIAAGALPETDAACASVLTLPCFAEMVREEADAVADAVNAWAP
jgi:dTDP-3-amino-2,3,6-trideoxy-4-keto-D-glucose/dTDP-3-amino-3,4,6-trideoxy-alpha-D-glucose/dTDP-2,6-dideoxy-D-kanosamine transaminase